MVLERAHKKVLEDHGNHSQCSVHTLYTVWLLHLSFYIPVK